jgi:nucleotide-binding universal stress UspA family protein
MPGLLDRRRPRAVLPRSDPGPVGPVVLATLSVRVDPSAERMAFESALQARASLIVANMLALQSYPLTFMLAREQMTMPHEEDLDAVRATAERAAGLGIKTELLRISSRRPVRALLELADERRAGMLVFGPDLRRISRLRFRVAARHVRKHANCLVWVAPDG